MILTDVNVLVYAFRQDTKRHAENRAWLLDALSGPENFGCSELILSSLVRIVTHPKVFAKPSSLDEVFEFTSAIRSAPSSIIVRPGRRHWSIFENLCHSAEARGNLIPDAYLAALAIENGALWVTNDRDFARFPGLRWSVPGSTPQHRTDQDGR